MTTEEKILMFENQGIILAALSQMTEITYGVGGKLIGQATKTQKLLDQLKNLTAPQEGDKQ